MAPLRKQYDETIKSAGADHVDWAFVDEAGDISCVTQSQLSRLFLYQKPYVNASDIIITVDVNLFPMTSHILEPIEQFPNLRAWIFQYEDTAHIETGYGETFNQVSYFCRFRAKIGLWTFRTH